MHSVLQFMDYLFYSLPIYHNQPWKLLFWLTSSFFYQLSKNDRTRARAELERSGSAHSYLHTHAWNPTVISIEIFIFDIFTSGVIQMSVKFASMNRKNVGYIHVPLLPRFNYWVMLLMLHRRHFLLFVFIWSKIWHYLFYLNITT